MSKLFYTDLMEFSSDELAQSAWVTSNEGGFDAEVKLLLHLNNSLDDESDGAHTFSIHNDITFDGTNKKFGSHSALFGGVDGDYLSSIDSDDWDIGTNVTIDLWVKHTDHVGEEMYISQYEDVLNRWHFRHIDGSGIQMGIWSSIGNNIMTPGGEITDTDWHHIAFIKVGSDWGIYKDGTQVSYSSSALVTSFTAELQISSFNSGGYPFDGNMDEIRKTNANSFGASPNAGLTDTIVVPTSEYSGSVVLQCYSEDTIIRQGSYSLKVEALSGDSLNETLTKTLTDYLDYSIMDVIKFDIRASRTGSNIKLKIHDTGGTTSEHTINIASADTWQIEEWDISGITTTDRDTIDKIIIEIINADDDNEIYIDNLYTEAIIEHSYPFIGG